MIGVVELTIDELAQRVGMTNRNVRAYQTRGLLPAPEIRGRTAFYGSVHLERLEAVRTLQSDGVSLDQVARLVELMPSARGEQLRALARASEAPFEDEEPLLVEAERLLADFGDGATPELMAQAAERFPHVRALEDGRYEVRSQRLYQAAIELSRLGVPLTAIFELTENGWEHASAVAEAFVELFLKHIGSVDGDRQRTDEVLGAIERLRPLAGESVVALFSMAMSRAIERAINEQ